MRPDSYGAILRSIQPVRINRAYGKVLLLFGLIQVGRQPSSAGPGMSIHDGSRSNRWGVSRYAYTSDRFLFTTKISELWRMATLGKEYRRDASMEDGVFLALAYDWVVNDRVTLTQDDLHQVLGMIHRIFQILLSEEPPRMPRVCDPDPCSAVKGICNLPEGSWPVEEFCGESDSAPSPESAGAI